VGVVGTLLQSILSHRVGYFDLKTVAAVGNAVIVTGNVGETEFIVVL